MDSPLETTRADLLKLEGELAQLLTRARYDLEAAEDELRQARKEAAKAQLEFFTEEEFAARLKISAVSLARARRKGLMPCIRLMGSIRYTTEHLVIAAELFDSRRPREVKGRKRA
jgi:uncharacterized protein (DUF3084 family)